MKDLYALFYDRRFYCLCVGMEKDIADYAKDGRLTEPSDGKRYEWRKMIDAVKALGRPLTDEEAEQYRVK